LERFRAGLTPSKLKSSLISKIMTRLVLTTSGAGLPGLVKANPADVVISFDQPFDRRFVWGPLPSPEELANFLAPRSAKHEEIGSHWLDLVVPPSLEKLEGQDCGLVELCERFETVELWADPDPNAQLELIWLLDYLRPHEEITSKLIFCQSDIAIAGMLPKQLAGWRPRWSFEVTNDHLEIANLVWEAYRAPTPQAWFELLDTSLRPLPRLTVSVRALLEELPGRATGLGATHVRMLELLWEGYLNPIALFPHHPHQNRKVFSFFEAGSLLDQLAYCPAPAVSGFDDEPLERVDNYRARQERYIRSRLALTPLGKAIEARRDDFSRHNPIHRWWGGTKLTNDSLWRWDAEQRTLIAP
jgi:hypothetical protein